MATVTQRIKEITQPHGGYLPISSFKKEQFQDSRILHEEENIHASLVGLAVDYLTRFLLGASVEQAFHISCLGAFNIRMQDKASQLMSTITGLNDTSIIAACKLSGFDVCYRSSTAGYKPIESINPDSNTIENIRIMVERSLIFWKKYGPITGYEITFEGGYTDTVNAGDGDFVTSDTLWDFKVSKSSPTSKHSLQLLMYYIMGLHSKHQHFKSISNLGIFNPRLNIAYICPISAIASQTIEIIEKDVICYDAHKSISEEPKSLFGKSNATYKSADYTVADICDATGLKKSVVHADIRAGRLNASKKGNKYYITQEDYFEYIEQIKLRQKLQIIFAAVAAVIFIIVFFVLS